MRHALWMVAGMAAAGMVMVSAAAAQDREGRMPTMDEMEQIQRSLELRARESELEHQQQMQELELDERRAELDHRRDGPPHGKGGGGLLLLVVISHILLTVWVCKDMREQKIGRALWVPIVLLTGAFGAILYAIVRVADTRAKPPAGAA